VKNKRITVLLLVLAVLATACVLFAGTLDKDNRGELPGPTHDSPDRLIAWLQGVRITSPVSPAYHGTQLDNSIGEQLLEIQVIDPSVVGTTVEWVCTSKTNSSIYIVACSDPTLDLGKCPIRVPPKGTVTFTTRLEEDGYAYLVVDTDEIDPDAASGTIGLSRISITATVGGELAWDDRGHAYAEVRFYGTE
jgi:hypothetical protein